MLDQMVGDDKIKRLVGNCSENLPIIDNVDRHEGFVVEFRIMESQLFSGQPIYVPNP